jgi:hypothetical protein
MIHFRNKTAYRRRLGHRQRYTQVKITSITSGNKAARGGTTAKAAGGGATAKAARTGAPAKPAKQKG